MNIILLGPQGSGKGTQAKLLMEKYGFFYVSTGDLLRNIAKTNKDISETMKSGKLIPDEQTFKFMMDYLKENHVSDGILFDGYPRSAKQFGMFETENIKIDLILILRISDEEAVRRLSARRMHKQTGEIYNLITNPPSSDIDPGDLIQREDDKPEAILQRLKIFHSVTEELIQDIQKSGIRHEEVDAQRPIDDINKDLVNIIEEVKSGSR
ncbi:nucleoside monophosphate kinase [Candidatus Microgenomates bacterium]|nr:nucleoside monophosphate kinase [Candidatus Microgenomates bacterium]